MSQFEFTRLRSHLTIPFKSLQRILTFSLVRKESGKSQTMMRGRVVAQGATIFALMIGVSIGEFKRRENLKSKATAS